MPLFVKIAAFVFKYVIASGEMQRERTHLEWDAEIFSGSVNMPCIGLTDKEDTQCFLSLIH